MIDALLKIDRRWIFLLMGLSVLIPLLAKLRFPEKASPMVMDVFHAVDNLPAGSDVLVAFDYDPGSEPELGPMATAFMWHCARKGHRIYCLALWPLGSDMTNRAIDEVLKADFRDTYEYGKNYVNLGYKSGGEGVIKVIKTNLRELYTTDATGNALASLPMTRELTSIESMDLIISLSAGTAGTKEWIQYAATPANIRIVCGVTGVQAPDLFPYVPNQLIGMLGAIKGAAEYEQAVGAAYPEFAARDGQPRTKYQKGIERMGPQLVGHCLILLLIIFGNVIFALDKARRGTRR